MQNLLQLPQPPSLQAMTAEFFPWRYVWGIVYSMLRGLHFGYQHIPHLLKLLRKLLRGQDAGLVLLNDGAGLAGPCVEQPGLLGKDDTL